MRLSFSSLRRAVLALCCLAVVTSAQTAATTRPTGTGVITGRVAIGEKPATGVVVGLMNGQTFNPADSGAVVKATTDAEGRYRLNQVPAGSFRVAALAPGYVVEAESGGLFEQGKAVNLREGETVENMDFRLSKGGVITGKIMDATGKPLIEQRVSVWRFDAQGRKTAWNPPDGALSGLATDDRGIYRLYGMPEGRYVIAAGSSGGSGDAIVTRVRGANYKRTYYPDTTDETQAKVLEVTADSETKDIDIRLQVETIKGYSVLARVVDAETGAPVPNVSLSYMPYRGDRITMGGFNLVQTDALGLARFDGLPAGRYGLMLMNIGGLGAVSEYFSDTTVFEVLDSDIESVVVNAKRGATITGRAVLEGVTDPAVQAKLYELQLSAFSRPSAPPSPGSGPSMPSFGSNFKINRDGSFRLAGLQPGKVQFNTPMAGRGPTGFSVARIELDGVPQRDGIEVAAGQQVANVRLVFVYGQAIVRGQVQVIGGQLPQDARMTVIARRADSPATTISGLPSQVDGRGQFVIQGLAPGEYELTLSAAVRSATTMTITSGGNNNTTGVVTTGTIVTATTTTTPPTGTTPTPNAQAFTPKTVKQKVIVPAAGEVPVAMTLDLTPRGN